MVKQTGTNTYCGTKEPVPKGKVRGSEVDCYKQNQIRYYGTHKVDPLIMNEVMKQGKKSLQDEAFKLNHYQAKLLKIIEDIDAVREKIKKGNLTEAKQRVLQKKLETLIKNGKVVQNYMNKQVEIVKSMQKTEDKIAKLRVRKAKAK